MEMLLPRTIGEVGPLYAGGETIKHSTNPEHVIYAKTHLCMNNIMMKIMQCVLFVSTDFEI